MREMSSIKFKTLKAMKKYVAAQAEEIYVTATNMAKLSDESGEEVECIFNSSTINAKPGNSPKEIVDQYWSKAPERP